MGTGSKILDFGMKGLTVHMYGSEALGNTKKYIRQQRQGTKKIDAPVPPGGVPPMKKISVHQALRHYLKKQAAPPAVPTLRQAFPTALLAGLGLATATGLAVGGARGVGGAYQRFQSKRMFEELQRRYPEIKRHPKAREYFDLIVAYAPSLMKHPAAIGDFLRRQLEYPMSSVEFIKQLADLESTVSKTETQSLSSQMGLEFGKSVGKAMGPFQGY